MNRSKYSWQRDFNQTQTGAYSCTQSVQQKTPPFHLCSIYSQAQHWETECLFEVILYTELLHGNTLAFSLQRGEFVLEINEESDFSPPCSFFVRITGNYLYECKTHTYFHFSSSRCIVHVLFIGCIMTWNCLKPHRLGVYYYSRMFCKYVEILITFI